jgi:hypothetical protein
MASKAVEVGQVWVWNEAWSVRYRVISVDGRWARLARERDGAAMSTPLVSLAENWTQVSA